MKNIAVAINPAFFENEKRAKLQKNAFRVLSMAPKNVLPVAFDFIGNEIHPDIKEHGIKSLNILKKDAAAILGNSRRLPYIDEIMNCCAQLDCDIIGYINSDILMNYDVYKILESDCDAFSFQRYEVQDVSPEDFMNGRMKIIPYVAIHGGLPCGIDGFFFKKDWWIKNAEHFTDQLVIGEASWDYCYDFTIKKLAKKHVFQRCLFHVYHTITWKYETKAALNNRKTELELKAKQWPAVMEESK